MGVRGGTSPKHLLDDHKEKREYWKLKDEVPVRALWRTCFGRGYEPVVKQAKIKWIPVLNFNQQSDESRMSIHGGRQ